MSSRRSFLTTIAVGATASVAGCSVLDSGGGSGLPGQRWLTEGTVRIDDASDSHPVVDSVTVTAPARATAAESLPEPILEYQIRSPSLEEETVPMEDVDRSVGVGGPPFSVDVGDFSASAAESAVPTSHSTEIESDLDVRVYFFNWHETSAFAATDGLLASCPQASEPEQAVELLEPILAAADGAGGESLLSTEPTGRLSEHLEDGIFASYWDVGGERPVGLTIALDGDTARRRIVQVWNDEDAAAQSQLLDEELRSSIERRDYQREPDDVEPVEDASAERDGRVVETEVTIPADRLVSFDFEYPPNVDFNPS